MHNKFLSNPEYKTRNSAIQNISCITRMTNSKEINEVFIKLKEEKNFNQDTIDLSSSKIIKKNLNFLKFQNLNTIIKYNSIMNKLKK